MLSQLTIYELLITQYINLSIKAHSIMKSTG